MKDQLAALPASAEQDLARADSLDALEQVRLKFLGRKGELTQLLAGLAALPPEDRKAVGKLGNDVKNLLTQKIAAAETALREREERAALAAGRIDVTIPGAGNSPGAIHPLTQTLDEMIAILTGMGFAVEEGPDVESDYNNFEALNIGKDHPARDMQATFFVSDEVVLRTHTSPVQIRTMKKYPPPLRIICPGRVYRCDSDLSHSPMFHQVEGLMVDERITFGDLKGVLMTFIHEMFGQDVGVRFRPSYFPFTEPSAEVDIQCVMCKGEGCRVCKQSGWLEILGSGMVHPNVLANVGYDPEKFTGFAFGMGVERIAMLKFRIDSIRAFFENDFRFLSQF